jgi:hypothetical protein
MLCGGSAILVSLALLKAVKSELASSSGRPGIGMIANTYSFVLAPAAMVFGFALCLILLPWHKLFPRPGKLCVQLSRWDFLQAEITVSECALIAGFLLIPVFSFLLAFVNSTPLFTRYGLSAVLGFGCLIGIAASRNSASAVILLAVLTLQYRQEFASFRYQLQTREPVTSFTLEANWTEFSKRYQWMKRMGKTTLPIVLIDDLDFAPTVYYAPPELQRRMIFGWTGDGVNAKGYLRLMRFTDAPGSVMPLVDTVRAYPAFFLFATNHVSTARSLQDNGLLGKLLLSEKAITMLQAEGDMELLFVEGKRP